MKLKFIKFIPLLALGLLFSFNVQAKVNCDSPSASWNNYAARGLGSFECLNIGDPECKAENTSSYTIVATASACTIKNSGGQRGCCVRAVDCGGVEPVLGSQWDCLDTSSPDVSGKTNCCVPWHCGGGVDVVCCDRTCVYDDEPSLDEVVLKPRNNQAGNPTEESAQLTGPKIAPTVAPTKGITFSSDSCCKSIVRPLYDESGNPKDYTLNDVIQTAVNIYECILCIVGALILIMFILGGVVLIISGGSADKVALGKRIIVGAVVGGIIAFSTYLIIYWTVTALGANFITPFSEDSSSGGLYIDKGSEMVK